MTHWYTLLPIAVLISSTRQKHMLRMPKYNAIFNIPNLLNSQTLNQPMDTCHNYFSKRFDSVKPWLKFESNYNELTDVGTTYIGKNGTDCSSSFILEESFPCDPYAWTTGILPDGSQVTVQIDTGATKCIMSKGFHDAYAILHSLPKYKPYTTTLEIGDSSYIPVNFIIPLIISFKDHTFEIYTLVNGSTNNELLLLGMPLK